MDYYKKLGEKLLWKKNLELKILDKDEEKMASISTEDNRCKKLLEKIVDNSIERE